MAAVPRRLGIFISKILDPKWMKLPSLLSEVEYEQWQDGPAPPAPPPEQMEEISPEYVNLLTAPTEHFLCELCLGEVWRSFHLSSFEEVQPKTG